MNERSVTAKSRNTFINVKHLEEKGISYKKYYWNRFQTYRNKIQMQLLSFQYCGCSSHLPKFISGPTAFFISALPKLIIPTSDSAMAHFLVAIGYINKRP